MSAERVATLKAAVARQATGRKLGWPQRLLALLASAVLSFALLGSAGCAAPSETSGSSSDSPAAARSSAPVADESHLTFRNERTLQEHFEKHGNEVGCRTAEEYLAAANAVVANPDSLHKLQAEDGDDVYFLEDTGEFVVVSPKGYIRTYFITDRGYYNRQ